MDGKWEQVKIGEVRIDDRTFHFDEGESEATVFPGIITQTLHVYTNDMVEPIGYGFKCQ